MAFLKGNRRLERTVSFMTLTQEKEEGDQGGDQKYDLCQPSCLLRQLLRSCCSKLRAKMRLGAVASKPRPFSPSAENGLDSSLALLSLRSRNCARSLLIRVSHATAPRPTEIRNSCSSLLRTSQHISRALGKRNRAGVYRFPGRPSLVRKLKRGERRGSALLPPGCRCPWW